MREIKFKAWDKKENMMRQIITLETDHHSGGLLMQYTGLKDKNGNEIYEGDIVKPVQIKGMRWKVGTVEYQRGEFVVVPENESSSFKTLTDIGWLRIEIIGNIYENPELISN